MRLQTDGWKVVEHFGPNLAVRRQCLWVGSGLNDFSCVPACTSREHFMYRPNSASQLGIHFCTVDSPSAQCVHMCEGCRTTGNMLVAAQLLVWQNRKQVDKRTDVQMRLQTDGSKVVEHFGPTAAMIALHPVSSRADIKHDPVPTCRKSRLTQHAHDAACSKHRYRPPISCQHKHISLHRVNDHVRAGFSCCLICSKA